MSVSWFMINDSIQNVKDLDKLRNQYNYQYYQVALYGSFCTFPTKYGTI